jgi:macrolide transport system ATP-binding/permease protein
MDLFRHIFQKFTLRRRDEDLQRELSDHLELEAEEQRDQGADPVEARYRAMRTFGNVGRTQEDVRQTWGFLWLEQLAQDLRLGLRRLRFNPGFGLVAVLTFALGVGANTAVFSLIYAVAFRPLPVENPRQLYSLGDSVAAGALTGLQQDFSLFSYRLYQEVRDHTPEFSAIAAFETSPIHVSLRAENAGVAVPYAAEFVSGNYFETLGSNAVAGRTFTQDNDRPGAAPVVVLSYRVFQERFGADRSIVGRSLFVNGQAMTLVGIAPAGFFGETLRSDPPDLWLPLSSEPLLNGESAYLNHSDAYWLYGIGRLAAGAELGRAQARVTAEVQRWYAGEGEVPAAQRADISKVKVLLTPAATGIGSMERSYGDGLRLMTIFSGLILLISCANVSNLLLARAVATSSQTALRVAIGASRSRLVRQFLTEGVVIALLGGVAGVGLAFSGTRLLLALAFHGARYVPIEARPSLTVLAITFVLSLANGILFSTAPAWLALRTQPVAALGSGGRTTADASSVMRKSFVALQAALSIILLIGAGLLTKSLDHLRFQQFGFEPENRYVVRVNPSFSGYTVLQLQELYRRLEEELSQISGIKSVSFSFVSPMSGGAWINAVRVKEDPGPAEPKDAVEGAAHNNVSDRYFETMGIHLLRGRLFEHDTSNSRPVAVVTRTFVKEFFQPGEDPIGKHVDRGELSFAGDYEIVGVVEDVKYSDPWEKPQAIMFVPLLQMANYANASDRMFQNEENHIHSIQLETAGAVPDLEAQVRRVLAGIDQNLAVLDVITLNEQVERDVNSSRLVARITSLYGLLSLLLASVALYGVAAYAVARRMNEIGIRMALGADRAKVFRMILRSSLAPILLGLGAGILTVMAAGRLLASQLYGVRPADPAVIAGATLILSFCALAAGLLPAMRAALISPAIALRRE